MIEVARQTRVRQVAAFSRCVRAHGVPGFPDPSSHGVLPPARLRAIHRSRLAKRENAAFGSCAHLLRHQRAPLVAVPLSPKTRRSYATCMRTHGLPHFAFATSGNQAVATRLRDYLKSHLREAERASRACRRLVPKF